MKRTRIVALHCIWIILLICNEHQVRSEDWHCITSTSFTVYVLTERPGNCDVAGVSTMRGVLVCTQLVEEGSDSTEWPLVPSNNIDFEEQVSSQCNKQPKSQTYFNYPKCAPGQSFPKPGQMYLYAVPRCQSTELYDIDKIWGGAHISLGKWDGRNKFDNLKKWLANTSNNGNQRFKKGTSWHPSIVNPVHHNTNCPNGPLPWYEMLVSSPTLDIIHEHITKHYATDMGKLHISAVPSGKHKTSDEQGTSSIIDVITDHNFDWVVALVKIVQDANGISILRQEEAPILAIA